MKPTISPGLVQNILLGFSVLADSVYSEFVKSKEHQDAYILFIQNQINKNS